ncbi:LacI family DNA-binding transcriptional regulator [Edwardsiella tarda]|uniref:LacI family DNA-binding transcriptional regulator n=1 Tax=Edwardsiella tarda TaxID=636 RepID=UPI00351C30A8
MPTIRDVARVAGVGKSSVSRYLNGEQHALSDALKARIEHAIEQLNYRPNPVARSLRNGQTRLLGLILADIANPYSLGLIQGIESVCQQRGFTLLLGNSANSAEQMQRYLTFFASYRVQGLLLHPPAIALSPQPTSPLPDLPHVIIDRYMAQTAGDFVGLDNQLAMQQACAHLYSQHYDALLFLSEPIAHISSRRERWQSFQQITARYPTRLAQCAQVEREDNNALDMLLYDFYQQQRAARRRGAILVANGALTQQVTLALLRLGLRWGHELGLLGFDDAEWYRLATPTISAIRQPTMQIGILAAERLIQRLNGDLSDFCEQRCLPELIIRQSTCSN